MNFLFRKMIEQKMKDVPEAQREMILNMIEKNPELFKKIAEEIKVEIDSGKEQMTATMSVMQKYQNELKAIAQK
jgi:2-oxo-4-hydroxy-4-carboxy--5-ureidoimidazoline (OHCU) decarboxylase